MDEPCRHVFTAVEDEYLATTREIDSLRKEIDAHTKLLAAKRNDVKLLTDKRDALARFLGFDE
jgi:hypothetical protein